MRSFALIVPALALLVLLGWLWMRDRPGATGTSPSAARDAAARPESPRAVEPEAESAGSAATPVPLAQRDAVAEAAAPGATCRIRVVEAASKAPVPEARVWMQRAEVEVDSSAWRKAMGPSNDVELVLRSGLGEELALDEHATALVPRPPHARILAAARGELHGDTTLEVGASECVVELKPYHALAIDVVDRAERPVPGALVALYWGEFDPLENVWTWAADAAGRVWLPKLEDQVWIRGFEGPLNISLGGGVAGEPAVARFTLATIPTEPVRLVAGDHARVVLQLVDSRGAELALEGDAHLELVGEWLQDPSPAARAGADFDAPLSAGRAVFETVGLGMTLDVMLAADGRESVWRDELPGPTEAGQELRVLVPVGEPLARARGRVRGVRACFGDPGPSRVLLTGRCSTGMGYFWAHVEEGQDFDSPLQHVSRVGTLDGSWTLELGGERTSVRATAVPVLDERAEVVDFGDLQFEPMPELARVKVRDDSGAPVAEAQVESESAGGERQGSSDESGVCLLTGPLAELPMRIRATHRDWLPSDWTRIDAPGSETTLVVRRGAKVLGQLLLPRGARLGDFEVRLRIAPDAPASEEQVAVTEPKEGGGFRLAPCQAGHGRLIVYNDGSEVYERSGIELAAGKELELEPIDLRDVLHPFELGFELASGETWSGGHLEVREPDGSLSTWTAIGRSGRASFLSLRSSVDVWVAGRGGRAMFFQGVMDGDRLTLPAAPSVRLRLPRGIGRPEPPLVLQVRGLLQSAEEQEFATDEEVDVSEAVVGEDGMVWMRVSRPGRYEIRWFVRHTGTGVEFAVERAQAQVVEVTETSEVPVVEAQLTREEVERAISEAGG